MCAAGRRVRCAMICCVRIVVYCTQRMVLGYCTLHVLSRAHFSPIQLIAMIIIAVAILLIRESSGRWRQ